MIPRRDWMIGFVLLATLVLMFAAPGKAQVDAVVTLDVSRAPISGYTGPLPVQQSFIVSTPTSSNGNLVILLPGKNGNIHLEPKGKDDGTLAINSSNFLVRSRWFFAAYGFVVLTLDSATDFQASANGLTDQQGSSAHIADVLQAIAVARSTYPGMRVWVVRTSRGTAGAFVAAGYAPKAGGPDGLVFASSINDPSDPDSLLQAKLANIVVPTLIASNPADGCGSTKPANIPTVIAALTAAPITASLSFPGGDAPLTGPCDALSFHGFFGIESSTVNSISQWILLH